MPCRLPCAEALRFDALLMREALEERVGVAVGVGAAEIGRFFSTMVAELENWFRSEVGLPDATRRSAGLAADRGRPASPGCLAALRGRRFCWVDETPVRTDLVELPRSGGAPLGVRREPILNWVGL